MDYQAHALKIVPILASSFVYNLGLNKLGETYFEFVNGIQSGGDNFKPLKYLHHFSAGLKAFLTNDVYNNLTVLRECCGGSGFLAASGLPYLCKEYAAYVTFEGDNTVMF